MHPLGRRREKAPSRGGSGCVVQRPSRVEVVSISTPAFGHRGALAAILHFHVDSPPVFAFGGRALARTSFGWWVFLGGGGRGE